VSWSRRRAEAGQEPQRRWLAGEGTGGNLGNSRGGRPRPGYAYIHSAIDAHSRLAYSEIHADERATTAIGFWRRARAFFAGYGITVERVLSDNGGCYRAKDFTAGLVAAGITQKFTKPYRPQTNGKVERFNRTLQNEWGYARPSAQKPPEPGPWTPGSTCTTIIGTTPPSEDHPSVASITWWGRTTSHPTKFGLIVLRWESLHVGPPSRGGFLCALYRSVSARDDTWSWHPFHLPGSPPLN